MIEAYRFFYCAAYTMYVTIQIIGTPTVSSLGGEEIGEMDRLWMDTSLGGAQGKAQLRKFGLII